MSVQPSGSGPLATVTPTGGLMSLQPSKSPAAKEIAGDPTKYDDPEPQRASAAKEILRSTTI